MTKEIFVNLKRFDVPKKLGGICPKDDPVHWIEWVIDETIKNRLHTFKNIRVTYLLPEALIPAAIARLNHHNMEKDSGLSIGCQTVYRENVEVNKNFGAFTGNFPASAAVSLGCDWAMIGHSEERRDKLGIMEVFEPALEREKAASAVNRIMNKEIICALEAGMDILLCIGETAEEKGEGSIEEQMERLKKVLKSQLQEGLNGVEKYPKRKVVIGYEPIWAIGPGKTPPGADYISFVSAYIKEMGKTLFGKEFPVVYGGGLKEENAEMISGIDTIDGGLVALTTFVGQIGFEPKELRRIIDKYQ